MNLERLIKLLLLVVITTSTIDIVSDLRQGNATLHILGEFIVSLTSAVALIALSTKARWLTNENENLVSNLSEVRRSAERWKAEAAKHIEGLSQAIDRQFSVWGFTPAENEIALLLLKGLSLKEIASIRGTTERTVRQQSLAIYAKSGLGGRAELSAYFLEDLLSPFSSTKK